MALHNLRSRFFESIEDAVDDLTAFIETGWSTSAVICSCDGPSDYRRTGSDAALGKPVYYKSRQIGIEAIKQNYKADLLTLAQRPKNLMAPHNRWNKKLAIISRDVCLGCKKVTCAT